MSNLDPALDGNRQQRTDPVQSQPPFSRTNSTTSPQYRGDTSNAGQPYNAPVQHTPYYHYQSPLQPSKAANQSVGTGSAQPTPDAHAFLPPIEQHAYPGEDSSQQNADDSKRQRACEACRGLKVRCDQDPLQPDVPCKRCAKAGRPCVITQPSRKRQKKADSRVAELEKKLDALTAVLNNRPSDIQANPSLTTPIGTETPHTSTADWQTESQTSPEPPSKKRRTAEESSEWDTRFAKSQLSHKHPEAKSFLHPDNFNKRVLSLVSREQGAELFKRYTEKMSTELPLVVFPKGTDGDQVFHEKPVLYLAILAAASFPILPPSLTLQLQDESMAAIAELSVRRGAKSLELIQAMLVITLFYKPPPKAEQTNFYQIIHMAAVMAIDIGLGKRYRKQASPLGRQEVVFSARTLTRQNSDVVEARRTWLGCYYLCVSASIVLRRPSLIRWTDYMQESIGVLENSPDAAPTDRLLCEHVKIQHICEDIAQQFLLENSNAPVNINDPKVTYALNVLENQLKSWKQQVPNELQQSRSLLFFEHVANLCLHEIALHMDHNVEDFQIPFTEESFKNIDSTPGALSPNKIAAIEACLKASHGILSTVLSYNVEEVLALPLLPFFVRCVYALMILIKMHVAITTPNSELGKIIKPSDLKIEEYVIGFFRLYQEMGENRAAKPEKLMKLLGVLSEWFMNYKDNVAREQSRSSGNPPQQQTPSTQPSSSAQYSPTPLQMLSQVASGHQQQAHSTPYVVNMPHDDVRRDVVHGQPDRRLSSYLDQQTLDEVGPFDTNILSMLDMISGQDYGFGGGFDPGYDSSLSGMGDTSGCGLNSWAPTTDGNAIPYNASTGSTAGVHGSW